jgi:6-phosphogluconolactonase
MLSRLRAGKLLEGYRGAPPGDRDALVALVQRVSALATVVPELLELDLNPVKVLPPGQGAVVVDGRMRIQASKDVAQEARAGEPCRMRVANRAWQNESIPERISGAPITTAADGDHFQERIRESTMKLEAPALPGSSGSRHGRFLHGCRLALLLAVIFSTVALPSLTRAAEQRVLRAYVGTYTGPKSKGIYAFTFDPATGKAGKPEVAVESPSPSFLAVHPSGRLLYSVGEIGDFRGKPEGIVAGFAIDPATGRLDALGQESSGGAGPCHLVVDSTGKHVLVANYGGGSVAVLPIRDGGKLGPATCTLQHAGASEDKSRQSGPHAHSIHLDAAQRFAFAADLGLDKILVYRWDPAKGTLTPNDPPAASVKPGSGPRHFTFGQGDRHAYAINEMACTVTAFDYDAPKGVLSEIQTISTLPGKREAGYSTAEVVLHPSGKFSVRLEPRAQLHRGLRDRREEPAS